MEKERLENIKEIERLEERKVYFEGILEDIKSFYCKAVTVCFDINSKDFNFEGNRESGVTVQKELLREYIEKEIETLGNQVNEKIKQLQMDR